jgi:hypothetical protein
MQPCSFLRFWLTLLLAVSVPGLLESRGETPKPLETGSRATTGNADQMPGQNRLSESDLAHVKPDILTRQQWGARAPAFAMNPHLPRCITLHHTAMHQQPTVSVNIKMRGLQAFSQTEGQLSSGARKPPWADVPYHFSIDCDGHIAEGRNMRYAGDTNTPYDPAGHIQVVLEGNFETEEPSVQQLRALERLAVWQTLLWGIQDSDIKGHKDYTSTLCPGKKLYRKLPQLRKHVEQQARQFLHNKSRGAER